MNAPKRYSRSIAAVKASLRLISGIAKAFPIVFSIAVLGPLGLDQLAGPACGLDLLARRGGETVCSDRQLLGDLTLGEDLERVAASRQAGRLQRLRRYLCPGLKALLQVAEIDGLSLGPEPFKWHRHFLVRPARLA